MRYKRRQDKVNTPEVVFRPQEVLIPKFYNASPTELLNGPLALTARLHPLGALILRLFSEHIWFDDPYNSLEVLKNGAVLLANHRDYADIPILGTVMHTQGLQAHYVAKAELFGHPEDLVPSEYKLATKRVLARFIGHNGGIPFDRAKAMHPKTRRSEHESIMALTTEALKMRRIVVIFPEGRLGQGDSIEGVSRIGSHIAMIAGVPIVPCGIAGTEGLAWNIAENRVRPNVAVHFGEPLDASLRLKEETIRLVMQSSFDSARELLVNT